MCLGRTLVVGGKGDRGKVRGRKWNLSMLPNFGWLYPSVDRMGSTSR